jgi:hypothetical protein
MTLPAESQKTLDAYLAALRKQLRELRDEDVNDIVEEIRFHVLDKTSSDTSLENVSSTLAALGAPEALASRYRTEELLKRAQASRAPVSGLRNLVRWTTLSVVGLAVFSVSVVGYCLGGSLIIAAVLKILNPHNTGLWKASYPDGTWSWGLGSGGQPGNGHELLGWWLVPLGLIIGTALLVLTFRFGSWSIRLFRRPRGWRAA